jgi:hypothetical protein
MPITSSAAKQSHIEGFAEGALGQLASKSAKHKVLPESTQEPISGTKKTRKRENAANDDHKDEKTGRNSSENEPIINNRGPVSQLWGAAVTSFMPPDLS